MDEYFDFSLLTATGRLLMIPLYYRNDEATIITVNSDNMIVFLYPTPQVKKAIRKCLCPKEKPLDPAYARLIILKSYETQNGHRILSMPQQQELTSNRFSMWKFCILMHKILHEGYEQILIDSYANIAQFGKLANFWSSQTTHHLAQCIIQYCKVLQRKIIFHQTYRHIKGNFECDYEKDLDVNTTFQLCLDMCDYLEDLLDLQHLIFIDLTTNQIFPDSKQGLCRLTAFTTIMTECNLMYQHLVDVLRLLHSQLSPDYISGLSVRFNNVIFIQLRRFYEQVRSLPLSSNYFDVPVLPTESPIVTGVYYTTPAINRNSHEPSAPLITDLDY